MLVDCVLIYVSGLMGKGWELASAWGSGGHEGVNTTFRNRVPSSSLIQFHFHLGKGELLQGGHPFWVLELMQEHEVRTQS